MRKILAILLTMVMLFTTLAFPLPVSAESVIPTGSIHTNLVKYAGNDDVTYDPATGTFQMGATAYWSDPSACLRLNPADGVTYSLEGLESITIELNGTPWNSSVLFDFYTENNETNPTKDPEGCKITTDPAEVKLYGNHTYTNTITVNIASIPEGATELKQIKIRAGANFSHSIKSITLNYAEGGEEPETPEVPTPVEGSILGNLTLIGGTSNASWDESTYTATFGGQYQRVHLGLKEGVTIPLANLVSFDVELEEASTGKTYFTFYTTTSTSSEPTDYKVVTDITGIEAGQTSATFTKKSIPADATEITMLVIATNATGTATAKVKSITLNYDIPEDPGVEVPTKVLYPTASNVKHLGRTYVGNNATWLGWSGSGIEFSFTGTDLSINIEGDDTITQPDPWHNGGFTTASGNVPRYAIFVDGVKVVDEIMLYATSNVTHKILENASYGTRTIRIVKLTDAGTFNLAVKGITVNESGSIAPTAKGSLFIEFIGDSITSGTATDSEGMSKYGNVASGVQNAALSYGYKTAELLGADYSIVSMPGYGVALDESKRIATFYTYTVAKGGALDGTAVKINHNFGTGADYVVINLGTNDGSSAQATFESEYVTFLNTIRSKNPNAHIICTLGTMSYKTYDYIVNAVNTYKANSGDANISVYKLTATHSGGTDSAHPSSATQAAMAQEMAAYITSIENNAGGGDSGDDGDDEGGEDVGTSTSYALTKQNVKYLGRAYQMTDGALWLGYSGSGMEFSFTGTEVSITVKGADNIANWSSDTNMPRYAIYVDGVLKVDNILSAVNETSNVLTATHTFTGLDNKAHTVKVIKLSSAGYCGMAITNLTTNSSNGVSPTAQKDLLIEFIGDSITCGYGNEGNDASDSTYKTSLENITKSYGYIAAEALGADATFVSIGGHGVVSSYSNDGTKKDTNLIAKYYTKLGGKASETGNVWNGVYTNTIEWGFEDDPDIVVINLGTNDESYVSYSNGAYATERKAEFEAKYVELLELVRSKRPNAHIVCTLGTMSQYLWDSILGAVATYSNENDDNNISTFSLGTKSGSEVNGDEYHPSAETHARVGQNLATYLETALDNIESGNTGILWTADNTTYENGVLTSPVAWRTTNLSPNRPITGVESITFNFGTGFDPATFTINYSDGTNTSVPSGNKTGEYTVDVESTKVITSITVQVKDTNAHTFGITLNYAEGGDNGEGGESGGETPDTPDTPDQPENSDQPTWAVTQGDGVTYENGVLTSPTAWRAITLTSSIDLNNVESITFDFGTGFNAESFTINYSDGSTTSVPGGTKTGEYTVTTDPNKTVTSISLKAPDDTAHTFGITVNFGEGGNAQQPDEDGLINVSYPLTNSNVKYLGRAYLATNGALWLSYSGAGMEFEFTGTSVTINLQGADGLQYWGSDQYMPRYAIYIDGELMVDRVMPCVNDNNKPLTASHKYEGLTNTKHTVKVIKISSANSGDLAVTSLFAKSSNGLTPTAEKELKIEFVGDSITCGYGNEDTDKTADYQSATENITKAYGYLTAEKLGADATFVSIGGYGVVSGVRGSDTDGAATPENVMSLYYTKVGNKGGGNKWNGVQASDVDWHFNDDVDIVVINLGTNDASYVNHANGDPVTRAAEFEAKYVEFLELVRANRPDAHIVCTLGTMSQDLWTNIENAVATFEANGGSNISTYSLGIKTNDEGYGAGYHPSTETHARMSTLMADYLEGIIEDLDKPGTDEPDTPTDTDYITTSEGVKFDLSSIEKPTDSEWNNETKVWVSASAYNKITFTTASPIEKAYAVKFNLTSSEATSHNIGVIYSDGTYDLVWVETNTEESLLVMYLDVTKSVSSIQLQSGDTAVDMTVGDISFLTLKDGQELRTEDVTSKLTSDNYDATTRTITFGGQWSTTYLNVNDISGKKVVAFTVEYGDRTATYYTSYRNELSDNGISPLRGTVATDLTSRTYAVKNIDDGLKAIGWQTNTANSTLVINKVEIIYLYDENGSDDGEEGEGGGVETPDDPVGSRVSIHTDLVKYGGSSVSAWDAEEGIISAPEGTEWFRIRLNNADGLTYNLEKLVSITIELDEPTDNTAEKVWVSFYTDNDGGQYNDHSAEYKVPTDIGNIDAGETSATFTITGAPITGNAIKEIEISASNTTSINIKSITLNYEEDDNTGDEGDEPELPVITSIRDYLVKFNSDLTNVNTWDAETGAINIATGWNDHHALRLAPSGMDIPLVGLTSITVEFETGPNAFLYFDFYSQDADYPTNDPVDESKIGTDHTYAIIGATSITFNITSIPEGATELKQIKINGDDGTTASIKSITLNYAEAPSISNTQLTLGADIALQFYVPADSFGYNAYSNPVISATIGEEYEVASTEYTYDENTNSYVFRIDGIASILMSEDIIVTLTSTAPDGGEHIVKKGPIKISDLCDYYIENGNENISELSDALKNYGYASEIYKNGTSNIDPTEIKDVFAELGGVNAVQGALARTNKPTVELATWKSVNLFLDDSITLNFKFSTAETIDKAWKAEVVYGHGGAKVTDITEFEAVGNNVYKISFNTWSAEDFSAPVAITLVNGDTRISYTLHYSILDYAISAESRDLGTDDTQSQNLRLLTRALLRYIAALDLYNGRTSWDMDGMRAVYVNFYGEPETEEPDAPTEIPQPTYYVSSGNGIYDNTNKTLSGLSSWQTPTVLSVNTIEGGWRNVESVTFTLGNTVGYGGVTALFADGTEEYLCGWQEFDYVTTFSEVISEANRSKELIGFRYARGDSNSVLLGITLNYVEGYVPEIPDQPVDSTGYSGFLRASGTKVVDQNGKEYVIKAMGFSNYSMNYYSTANNIEGVHHTEESFAEVKGMGFNTVRFLINYNLFEDDNTPYVYKESGFDWIDKNIQWAKNNGLRIILDMHTPQGGYQSWDREQYKIDGYDEGDALWLNEENQKRLTALWKEIAQRYADEETIIGYSIVNEPVIAMDGLSTNGSSYLATSNSIYTRCINLYKNLMDTTIAAIRTVDTNHIIFSQRICAFKDPDLDWANWVDVTNHNFVLSSDKNVVYEFHFYKPGDYTGQKQNYSYGPGKSITYEDNVLPYLQQYKSFSTANNVPLFAGEYGVVNACFYNNKGGQQWVSDVLSYFIENGIGSAYHMYYGGSSGGYDYGMYTTWSNINVGSSQRDNNLYTVLTETLANYE